MSTAGRTTRSASSLNGRFCRIIAHGAKMHSVLVEFENGERVITSARAVHKRKREA